MQRFRGSFVGHTARKPPLDGAFFYCLLGWKHRLRQKPPSSSYLSPSPSDCPCTHTHDHISSLPEQEPSLPPHPCLAMYWNSMLTNFSRQRASPPPATQMQSHTRPTPTPYPYPLANPALSSQFDLIPSANSTPTTTPAASGTGSENDHDADADGDHENEQDAGGSGNPTKSGRAGNRRRQKYSRTRTGCLSCRTRRIKCDEGRPVCKRCIIAKKTVSLVSYGEM